MIILGAKGFAKQLLPTLLDANLSDIVFFDDHDPSLTTFYKYPVLKSIDAAQDYLRQDCSFALGVGSPLARRKLCEKFESIGGKLVGLISSQALVSRTETYLGEGIEILQAAVIESFVSIGKGCLINVGATICHDSIIGDFCEVGPNVTITGGCKVGNDTSIGASATIIPGISVGKNVRIGAGAVVTKDIPASCVAVGVPAKVIKQL